MCFAAENSALSGIALSCVDLSCVNGCFTMCVVAATIDANCSRGCCHRTSWSSRPTIGGYRSAYEFYDPGQPSSNYQHDDSRYGQSGNGTSYPAIPFKLRGWSPTRIFHHHSNWTSPRWQRYISRIYSRAWTSSSAISHSTNSYGGQVRAFHEFLYITYELFYTIFLRN